MQIEQIEKPGFKVSNPVTHALTTHAFRASSDPIEQKVAELTHQLAQLENQQRGSVTESSDLSSAVRELVRNELKRRVRLAEMVDAIFSGEEKQKYADEITSFLETYSSNAERYKTIERYVRSGQLGEVRNLITNEIPF